MTKYLLVLGGLIFSLGCKEKEAIITIVNIGHLDRNGIAKELRIINKYGPKVVGLDFLLTTDSLEKDILLSKELARTKNIVQATKLHNNHPFYTNRWDSLERYHPKFRFGLEGFSNHAITDDSIIVRDLPMRQVYRNEIEFTFSYIVASQYDFSKIVSAFKNGDEDFTFDRKTFGHYFKVISVEDLMAENFDGKDITDKIVLMGHVSGKEDSYYLDDNKTKRLSGVEFHACIIKKILE
jgi:CHASE2 domain-containing sensor protein